MKEVVISGFDECLKYAEVNGKTKEYDKIMSIWIEENNTWKQVEKMCHVTEMRA